MERYLAHIAENGREQTVKEHLDGTAKLCGGFAEAFGAVACEMEGAAVAQVAYINHTPFAVLRAISDSASGDAQMEYTEFCKLAAARSHAILDEFIKSAI